jgi:hypothetical protein
MISREFDNFPAFNRRIAVESYDPFVLCQYNLGNYLCGTCVSDSS